MQTIRFVAEAIENVKKWASVFVGANSFARGRINPPLHPEPDEPEPNGLQTPQGSPAFKHLPVPDKYKIFGTV
jgi:hypothetical protein